VARVCRSIARTVGPVYAPARDRLAKGIFAPGADLVTSGYLSPAELDVAAPDRRGYKAVGWSLLPRILRVREVSVDDTFVDYGSGMGRILYQAAMRYPFQRVIGVEVSEDLNRIARSNVERNRPRLRCQDVEIVTADAREWDPPPGVTVAFFHNPFTGAVFEAVLDKLFACVNASGRPLRIIYCNPIEHELLMATGCVRVVRRLRGWRPDAEWSASNTAVMYETLRSS
jgi:hypothetical protein